MSEDDVAAIVRARWRSEQKAETLVAVPLPALIRLIGTAHKAVSTLQTAGLLAGDGGRVLLREADRLERTVNLATADLRL